jgi:hypothetical protein
VVHANSAVRLTPKKNGQRRNQVTEGDVSKGNFLKQLNMVQTLPTTLGVVIVMLFSIQKIVLLG